MEASRALITGVGGFVGPYLVQHLVKNGFEVFGIDRKGAPVRGCKVESCDVTDYAALAAVVKKVKPDVIVHLAGQSSVTRSWKEPGLSRRINVDGARNLYRAVVTAKIRPRILLVSSAEVYGIPERVPMTEEHPLAPVSPYGESKVEQEELARQFLAEQKIETVIARSFNHTGPGQPAEFVCSNFAKQVADIERKRQQPVIKVGDLTVKRDFSDVRDVVSAYLLLLQKGVPGQAYNVCSGSVITINEVLTMLLGMSAAKVKVEEESSRILKNALPVLQGDNMKLRKATGWKPAVALKDTLSELLDYWRLA